MESKTYTKRDISNRIAKRMQAKQNQTYEFVHVAFDIMREMLCEDNDITRIEIRNFGVFTVKPTKAKPRARNPRTNEEVYVPAHKKTHFKPGKIIKKVLSKSLE